MWGAVGLPRNENFDSASAIIDAAPVVSQNVLPSFWAGVIQAVVGREETQQVFETVASICIHPNRPFVAVLQSNVLTLFMVDPSQFPYNIGASISLSRHRFNGCLCSFTWTYEHSLSFIVGTSTGVYFCTLPTVDGDNAFDATTVDIRPITMQEKIAIDLVTASPHGRLFACGSSKHPGKVFVGDAWMGTVSSIHSVGSTTVANLHWLQNMPCLVATAK